MSLTRRQMMKRSMALAAASAAVSACGGPEMRNDSPQADVDAQPPTRRTLAPQIDLDLGKVGDIIPGARFPLGVAAGDFEDGQLRLWTRFTGQGQTALYLWVFNATEREVSYTAFLDGVQNQVVQVCVGPYAPGTRLHYAFVEVDATKRDPNGREWRRRSEIGQVTVGRADDDMRPMVVGTTSCTSNSRDLSLLADVSDHNVDCFISLGDSVYADRATDLASYRGYWEHNLSTPGYRALRASTALYATWDDHEVTNNWDPETIDPQKVDVARAAFFEHLPRDLDLEDENRVWRRRRYGTCTEIFLLDSRSERTPSRRLQDSAEYLSRAQIDWLKAGLADSPARFKLVASSVPIAQMPFPMSEEDRWQGWLGPRDEILNYIDDENIEGVVWLSGDIHMGYVGRVSPPDVPGARQLEVCAGPGAQFTNPLFPWFAAPQFDFATGDNNWAELTLNPANGVVTVKVWGANARLLYEHDYQV